MPQMDTLSSGVCPRHTANAGLSALKSDKAKQPADGAVCVKSGWRRDPESNRARRICNPLHNRFAIAPLSLWLKEEREA